MTKLELAAKAREGADWIREHGFIQHIRVGDLNEHCAMGVVERVFFGSKGIREETRQVAESNPDSYELVRALAKQVSNGFKKANPFYASLFQSDYQFKDVAWVTGWNNEPGRTQEEMIDWFEATALQLEIEALAEIGVEEPALI